jgi:hypothetical protein
MGMAQTGREKSPHAEVQQEISQQKAGLAVKKAM